MPRISQLQSDSNVERGDRLLGTDIGGGTKNYSVNDLLNFLRDTNSAGVLGQLAYVYHNQGHGGLNSPQRGTISIDSYDKEIPFENIRELRMSTTPYNSTHALENFIARFKEREIIICNNENQDQFGVYICSSLEYDTENPGFFIMTLSELSSSGSIVDGGFYSMRASILSGSLAPSGELSIDGGTFLEPGGGFDFDGGTFIN